MNDKIRDLLAQISALQDELQQTLHEGEHRIYFELQGKRVVFEQAVREAHRRLRLGLWPWLLQSRPQSILSIPFIYGMAVPMVLLDCCISLYQWICFPLYGIPRVKRGDYFLFDRAHLGYLNLVEKINCAYCSYGNGLFAYAMEIGARTEQYWCPIKHARRMLGIHSRYQRFTDYGDGEQYARQAAILRQALAKEKIQAESADTAGPA
ncbi:MAG: hypothetical protein EKK46_13820 [Rhodocyclaceae bacterium]|nr:MAG: hypothetical protein EKK46_13820 [Rhodocyclaceae bacterium]